MAGGKNPAAIFTFLNFYLCQKNMNLAVIFDMDGVLVDNGDYHYKAWKIFCDKYNIVFPEDKFRTVFFGRTNEQVLSDLFTSKLNSHEIKNLGLEKEQIYSDIYAPHLKPVRGLISFLKNLKAKNIPVGVATSAPKENVDFVLKGLGIEEFVDVIVDDSMVSNGKPHPEIYLKAARLLNTEPKNCIVFEDSLSGTKSAFDAGTKVIALTTTLPAGKHQFAHIIISDFDEVSVEDILS
jgi:beta-phosphoglucomutase family hydrolase